MVYGVAIIGRNLGTFRESLQATYQGYSNNVFTVELADIGPNSILVTHGSCSSGSCFLVGPTAVGVGQSNVAMQFRGSPPSGTTVFNVTTSLGSSFQWNTSSPGFNPHIGKETLVYDGYDGYVMGSNPLYIYSLNVTNTGTADVTLEGGSCTGGCSLSPVVLKPNVVTVLKWGSTSPCPGYMTFTAVTALGNMFDFYARAC